MCEFTFKGDVLDNNEDAKGMTTPLSCEHRDVGVWGDSDRVGLIKQSYFNDESARGMTISLSCVPTDEDIWDDRVMDESVTVSCCCIGSAEWDGSRFSVIIVLVEVNSGEICSCVRGGAEGNGSC